MNKMHAAQQGKIGQSLKRPLYILSLAFCFEHAQGCIYLCDLAGANLLSRDYFLCDLGQSNYSHVAGLSAGLVARCRQI